MYANNVKGKFLIIQKFWATDVCFVATQKDEKALIKYVYYFVKNESQNFKHILRKINLDRYDDRDDVRINLIDSYDRINAFGEKHLPDPFFLEGTQRVSVRNKILREIASNILMHREFTNPFPAKFIIEKNQIK